MQFSLTDLQKEIKENAEKLLSEKIDVLETIRKIDENTRLDEDLWKLVIEQGWLALDVPEEDGGLGFSIVDTAILSEVLGYYMPIIPLFSSGIVFKQLVMHSSEELKGRILSEIISGEKIGSFAIYENDKYEINKENISAEMTKNDDGWIINGTKKYVMFGDSSDYLAVLVKEEESFKFVLINKDDNGVTIKEK